jgi:hypothetical protein
VTDRPALDRLAAAISPLTAEECMWRAHDAGALVDVSNIGQPRRVREYRAGDSFAFPGSGIHRMEHDPGAITIHVYSPPLRAIGHYELQDGELRRQAGRSDEPSSPSPGLLSAITAASQGRLDQHHPEVLTS